VGKGRDRAEYRCVKNQHLLDKGRTVCPIDGSAVRRISPSVKPPGAAATRTPRERRRGVPVLGTSWIGCGGLVALLLVAAIVGAIVTPSDSPSDSSAPDSTDGGSTAVTPPPKVEPLTATEKANVRSILLASVSHYRRELDQGVQIVGVTQYPSAAAGLDAFNDPSSAASKLSAYQQAPDPSNDLSFESALKKADSFYTADNEPQAIISWEGAMSDAQAALGQWVEVAVGFQIKEKTIGDLQAAEQRVRRALAKAQRMVAVIIHRS